jgi:Zn-dependent protease with chaperone function
MWRTLAVGLGVVLACWVSDARAGTKEDYEQKLEAELRSKDASLVEVFVRANQAREREDHATAEKLYAEVFEKAPTFTHAERRRCGELLRLGQRDAALSLCRDAVEKEAIAPNLTALASVLAERTANSSPSVDELEEAYGLLARAESLDPDDSYVALAQCQVAAQRQSVVELRNCSARLDLLAPHEPSTAWAAWLLAMSTGNYGEAEDQLERARKNGAPAAMLATMTESTEENRPLLHRAWAWVWRLLVGWVALAAVLVLAGTILSRVTLNTAENWTPDSARHGASLRSVYRGVLVVCSLLYYASLPLLLVLVVGLAGGLVYGMFAIGYIPIKLGLFAIVLVFATILALAKSLTFRPSDEAPGVHLDLANEPELRATLEEVAARIGTRAVDTVYLTPDTNLAVFERKRGERCLVVGAGVLEGMPLPAFKAILAHEYGHFSNRDTAGGGFALGVRRSLLLFIVGLAESGQAAPWNPAWLFANGFYRLFLRVSQGASRLQEILADRRAAEAYGGAAFASGLRHVLTCDLHFEQHVSAEIDRALKAKEPLQRLWSPLADRVTDAESLNAALNRDPSPYDSHPAPCDRIRWVEQLLGTESPSTEGADAWSLFRDRARHEREVTLFVYQRLAEAGVHPPALPKA